MPEKVIVKMSIAVIILILLLTFAIQNYHRESRVGVLFWQIDKTPLSIIIFASAVIGALIACIELVPYVIKYRQRALRAERERAGVKDFPGSDRPGRVQE
ncbi:MAG: LapA family protein [Candidatus Aureabacteria bacterium]|nr:LapA family protein [Candidatus Auribacterota bacterium]